MDQPQTKTIGDHTFTVSQLPGMRSLKVFTRLAKVLGKGASGLIAKATTKEGQGAAILEGISAVEADDVEFLALELLTTATVTTPDGQTKQISRAVFDQVFQGRLDILFKALAFAVQVNFATFFRDLTASAAARVAAAKAPESSSAPSSPSSGQPGALS